MEHKTLSELKEAYMQAGCTESEARDLCQADTQLYVDKELVPGAVLEIKETSKNFVSITVQFHSIPKAIKYTKKIAGNMAELRSGEKKTTLDVSRTVKTMMMMPGVVGFSGLISE